MSKIKKILLFVIEYVSDLILVLKYNSYSPFEEKQKKLFYRIIIGVHTIEKGLSLKSPRSLFGQAKFENIMCLIREYDPGYSVFPLEMASGAFSSYLEFHKSLGVDDEFLKVVDKWLVEINQMADLEKTGGARSVTAFDIESHTNYTDFLSSRFSCRAYADAVVEYNVVENVIRTAQKAPSQCNRQSSRVHCYQDKDMIHRLLKLQGGSAGFSDSVSNLFVLTSELTAWGGAGQRNQAYIDGALFSMYLMLSCQSHGLTTCPLNLAVVNKIESKIKTVGGIHQRERLIMMIAFGYPVDDKLKAACSPRMLVDDVLKIH